MLLFCSSNNGRHVVNAFSVFRKSTENIVIQVPLLYFLYCFCCVAIVKCTETNDNMAWHFIRQPGLKKKKNHVLWFQTTPVLSLFQRRQLKGCSAAAGVSIGPLLLPLGITSMSLQRSFRSPVNSVRPDSLWHSRQVQGIKWNMSRYYMMAITRRDISKQTRKCASPFAFATKLQFA